MQRLAFIGRKNGLCNRLEMLMAAYALRRMHGHAVLVDWPELSFMNLPLVRQGRPGWWRRLFSYQVLQDTCDPALLGHHRTIDIRGMSSIPDTLIKDEIRALGSRIGPAQPLAKVMLDSLARLQGKPVVGVHIRQGDFMAASENNYQAQDGRHTRVPIWWYRHVMGMLASSVPGVTFLMCVSGERAPLRPLLDSYNCVVCDFAFDFKLPRPGHHAESNPVADLLALASCSMMLGTPASSFSHWAASNLGPPTSVISPALAMHRDSPTFRLSTFRHRPLGDWVHFSWRDASQQIITQWDPATPCRGFDTTWWHASPPCAP